MIPGKNYSPDELFAIVWARKWLIVVGMALGATAGLGVATTMPERYESETTIMVVPQRVPEHYVPSTVTARIDLKSISPAILSRVRLERIITEFDLYRALRSGRTMDAMVQQMRDDIDVRLVAGDSFRVSYVSENAEVARTVTARLASQFIEENLKDRAVVAEDTSQFLKAELEEAKRTLEDQEKKLEVFRRTWAGELPSQLAANQQMLQGTQVQLQGLQESISRDRDRHLALDQQLAGLMADGAAVGLTPAGPPPTDPASTRTDQLEKERASLQDLRTHYTEVHPDVIRQKGVVRDLEQQVAREASGRSLNPVAAPAANPVAVARQDRARQLRADLDAIDRQIVARLAEERRLRDSMEGTRRHIEATPTRESELTSLTRDYDTSGKLYNSLLARKKDAEISANLERRQIGEQFKILDPAQAPAAPSSPNRSKMAGSGTLVGLALALALIAFVEYRNAGLRTEEELAACTGLPVIAVIPMMSPEPARPAPRRKRLLGPLSEHTALSAPRGQ